jgi:hypothetical protein
VVPRSHPRVLRSPPPYSGFRGARLRTRTLSDPQINYSTPVLCPAVPVRFAAVPVAARIGARGGSLLTWM